MELKDYKVLDFRKEIFERNKRNRDAIVTRIQNEYKDITIYINKIGDILPGFGQGEHQYDFIWLDGRYNNKNFRICFYTQNIDENSLNVHIYHGNYTLQQNLVRNAEKSSKSIFDKSLSTECCFKEAIAKISHFSYGIDNFNLDEFMKEFLKYIEYSEV